MMHGPEKSDPGIVAMKPANKTEQSVAEPVERRAGTKGNVDQQSTCRTQSRISVSQALERIRKVQNALPSHTRGGSRMRESRTYGSVRGALSNERPYRVRLCPPAFLWELGSARSDTEKSSAGNRRQAVGRHLLTSKQYLPE